MKKKLLLVSVLLSSQLIADSISFDMVNKNPERVVPNTTNEIYSFNNSVKDSMNSVVNISAKRHVEANMGNMPLQMFDDPIFKRFFGDQFGQQFKQNRIQRSLGSGVIVSKNGYIVTNNHVIENAEEITVTIGDNPTEYNAKLVGRDAGSDLAVIKLESDKTFSPIKLGYSNELKVGDLIFAIGNPFGIGSTVTQGIISALNKNKVGINRYENYIQTDASINPGNSGGALVDSRGALIGINTAIISKSGGNNGIGFSIPVDMVKDVVKKLVEDGKVTRGYLGVAIADLDKELKKVYKKDYGALVLDVSEDTPAAKYGIKRGDLIYSIGNKVIKDKTDLQNVVASFKPNDKVKIELERNGKIEKLEIVLGNREGFVKAKSESGEILGGLKLSEIDMNLQKQFRLRPDSQGILITGVEPKSNAEKAGFQAGDIVIQIESIEIKKFQDVEKALKSYNNRYKRVYVDRYGQTIMLVIK